MKLSRAIAIMSDLFKDRNDANGVPYAMHCIRVMQRLEAAAKNIEVTDNMRIAAILHDVPEDTPVDVDTLIKMGLTDENTIQALRLLTHESDETYEHYIDMIAYSHNKIAIIVKLADLVDNSDIMRSKPNDDWEKQLKYNKAYRQLNRFI